MTGHCELEIYREKKKKKVLLIITSHPKRVNNHLCFPLVLSATGVIRDSHFSFGYALVDRNMSMWGKE